MRCGALITYRLGRLTELNNIQTSTSLHILENQPWSYTHWRAGGHGADLIEGGQRPVTAAAPFWVMAVWGLAGMTRRVYARTVSRCNR